MRDLRDIEISVDVGVNISQGVGYSLTQVLNDAIRIGIKKDAEITGFESVHFIQFITKQTPDLYTFNLEKVACWDTFSHCMRDLITPRWKVDTPSDMKREMEKVDGFCPFYEVEGAHVEEDGWLYIYDQPGYMNVKYLCEERIIGHTFLIANECIFKEVRWSRQYECIDGNFNSRRSTYCYDIRDIDALPDWAIYTLQDKYKTNSDLGNKIYEIPDYLYREPNSTSEGALIEARESLLPAPEHWSLRYSENFYKLHSIATPSPELQMEIFAPLGAGSGEDDEGLAVGEGIIPTS